MSRGAFTLAATRPTKKSRPDATGLSRGAFTLAATRPTKKSRPDATGLSRGGSRSLLCSFKRETPRGKPVASGRDF
jgi:hypothetical protein